MQRGYVSCLARRAHPGARRGGGGRLPVATSFAARLLHGVAHHHGSERDARPHAESGTAERHATCSPPPPMPHSASRQRHAARPRGPPSSAKEPLSAPGASAEDEEELRGRIWQHGTQRDEWEVILSRMEETAHATDTQRSGKGRDGAMPLWEELVMVLLLHGDGEGAFRAWQRGSVMGGSHCASNAAAAACDAPLAIPTLVALSLYTLLVDGKPEAARDLLLLLKTPSAAGEVAPRTGLPEEKEGAVKMRDDEAMAVRYAQVLCQWENTQKRESEKATAADTMVVSLVSWLLSLQVQHWKRMQMATMAAAQTSGAHQVDGLAGAGPLTALVHLISVAARTSRERHVPSPLETWTPSDEGAAAAWRTIYGLTVAAMDVADEALGGGSAAEHTPPQPERGRRAADRWVAAVAQRATNSFTDAVVDALLATSAAILQGGGTGRGEGDGTSVVRVEVFRLLFGSLLPRWASRLPRSSAGPAGLTLASCLLLSPPDTTGAGFLASLLRQHHPTNAPSRHSRRIRLFMQAPLPLPLRSPAQQAAVAEAATALVCAEAFRGGGQGNDGSSGGAHGRRSRALDALSLLSSVFLPFPADSPPAPRSGGTSDSLVAFRRHPCAVAAVVVALTSLQEQSWRGDGLPPLALACPEWQAFVTQLLSRCCCCSSSSQLALSLAAPSGAPVTAWLSVRPLEQMLPVPPLTCATLHALWWLPDCLTLSPDACFALEQHLNDAARRGAEKGVAATVVERVAQRTGTNSRKTVLLLCRWAWVLASLDAIHACPASGPATGAAITLAQAVGETLRRCRQFHRPDLAHELVELLLCAAGPSSSDAHDRNAGSVSATLLAALVRAARTTAAAVTVRTGQRRPAAVVAALVKEVCLWRHDVFSSFAALVHFQEATRPAEDGEGGEEGDGTQEVVSLLTVVITQALCPPPLPPADSRAGQTPRAVAVHETVRRARQAARLVQEGCAWRGGALAAMLRTPLLLVSVGGALRACEGVNAAREAYGELMGGFLADGPTAMAGPFRGNAVAEAAAETCLFAQQQQQLAVQQQRGAGEQRGGESSVPASMEAWRRTQDALRRVGLGMLARFALHYVLTLWSWTCAATGDPVAFRERARHLTRILLEPSQDGRAGAQQLHMYASPEVARLMPPAQCEALRVLLLLFLVHYSVSASPPRGGQRGVSEAVANAAAADVAGGRGRSAPQPPSSPPSHAGTLEDLVDALIRRLPTPPRDSPQRHPERVARFVDRLCRHEAPELLGRFAHLAEPVARSETALRAALVHGVPHQLPPMTPFRPGGRPPARLSKAAVNALMDAGDWAAAFRAIPQVFTSPAHIVRKSLGACEAARPHPGVAWQGALAVWTAYRRDADRATERSRSLRGSPPRDSSSSPFLPPPAAAAAATAVGTGKRKGGGEEMARAAVGLAEVGRIASLLAHGLRWREALALFDYEVRRGHVDGYVFSQVAYALRGSGHADEVLALWARWRCHVGDGVGPTAGMVEAVVAAGLVGSQHGAASAACSLVREAVQPRPTAAPLPPGAELPLRLEGKMETVVQKLLTERWYESWQSALAVAVASGRPALVETVARESPLHKGIYTATAQAMRERRTLADMDAAQRAALARHVVGTHAAFAPPTDGDEIPRTTLTKTSGDGSSGQRGTVPVGAEDGRPHSRSGAAQGRKRRAAEEAQQIEQVLQDLLGD